LDTLSIARIVVSIVDLDRARAERRRPKAASVRLVLLSPGPSEGQFAREIMLVGGLVVGRVHQAVITDPFSPCPLALYDALEDVVGHQWFDNLVPGRKLLLHDRKRSPLDV